MSAIQGDKQQNKLQDISLKGELDIGLLKTIVSNSGGSLYIVQDNRVVFHNPQFNLLTGYTSQEMTQMEFFDLVHQKDKKLIKLLFSNNFKEISQKRSRSYTFRAVNKSGEMRWFKSNVSIISWQGKPALLDNCFDITQQKEFEQKLIEEELNFRLLVNSFEDMVFIISKRGVVVQANRSVFNRLAYKEHEVELKYFSSFFPLEQKDEVKQMISEAFFGKRIQFSGDLHKSNGMIIPVETRLFRGNWSGKEVVFAICQDISLRIEAERIIKLSEEKFSKAFENNAVMMTISTLEEGKYIDINETFLKATGLSREQVIGKTSKELKIFPNIELREQLKELIIKDGRARDLETTMISSKGEVLICSFSVELIDIQGKSCLLAVLSDITERKRAQEKIMLSEQRFRQLAELLPEKLFEADRKGMITFVNNYLLSFFEFSAETIEHGKHISNLFSKKSQRIIKDYLKSSKKVKDLPSIELIAQKADGTEFPALTHITAVIESGKVSRYMGIMVDISSRKEQELELIKAKELAEEASKAKEQFLSTMSHEIRTPMNAVIGMANILLQDNPLEHQMKNLRTLKFSAEGLMALLNDILDFSKIDAGMLNISRHPVNLKNLAEGVWSVHKHIANKKDIELKLVFDETIPDNLLVDSARLNQILTNLTSNAIKFTEKGEISISLKRVKETKASVSIRFSVTDTGIGIPIDQQEDIFKEFTQANYKTARKHGGTGLGLAISKKMVNLLKGEIQLKSQPGKGSEFFFTLCFRKSKRKQLKGKDETSVPVLLERKDKPFRVLVVEDNEINSFITIKFLKTWGIDTKLAENGLLALEMIENEDFDLILMDLEMPVMDGYNATEEIRKLDNPTKRKIPIIALTASAMLDVQKKIFSLGMNDFILKPFNPNDLKVKISQLLPVQ